MVSENARKGVSGKAGSKAVSLLHPLYEVEQLVNMQSIIESKLKQAFQPEYLTVENESHMHGGPATESHYKLTVVSDKFEGLMLVKRHRAIYQVLENELSGSVHALALHTYTPAEWLARNAISPDSPDCRGGSKLDT